MVTAGFQLRSPAGATGGGGGGVQEDGQPAPLPPLAGALLPPPPLTSCLPATPATLPFSSRTSFLQPLQIQPFTVC